MSFYELASSPTILSVKFTRPPVLQEFDAFIDDLTQALLEKRDAKVGLIFQITVPVFSLGMDVAQKMAAWMKKHEKFITEHVTASSVVVHGLAAHAFLKVLFSLRNPSRPCKVFGAGADEMKKALQFIK
jgi:hypothetical protein